MRHLEKIINFALSKGIPIIIQGLALAVTRKLGFAFVLVKNRRNDAAVAITPK